MVCVQGLAGAGFLVFVGREFVSVYESLREFAGCIPDLGWEQSGGGYAGGD